MKKLVLCLALIAAIRATSQNGAQMEYKISSTKGAAGSMKINYSEYGSASEFSMNMPQMPGGSMVTKGLVQKSNPEIVYIIDDKNKTYSSYNNSGQGESKEDTKTYVVKKIGEEKVNGYKCIHALVTEDNETHEVWNTKDMADFNKYSEALATNKKMGSSKRDKALKDAGCDGLPVKMTHKNKDGDMTMELVKFEKKSFSKSDFELPAGYTKNEGGSATGAPGVKGQAEIMKMSPEERAKYIEEMKKKYGK